MPTTVAILGATGRLGPAVGRALSDLAPRALSRRTPHVEERFPTSRWTEGDRRSVDALGLVDGADVVVDLLARDALDARALDDAIARATHPPRRIVTIACTAAPRVDRPAVRGIPTITLLVPRLVAPVDLARREEPYLEQAASVGHALFPGDAELEQSIVAVDDVARIIRELVLRPDALPPGEHVVAPAAPIPVRAAISALLRGAGLPASVARHPDPHHRAPHPARRDVVDGAPVRAAFADLGWTDPRTVYESLGAWLARTRSHGSRPRRVVSLALRRPEGRATIDVHGRRDAVTLRHPDPALLELAAWVSPAFYVDVGRPCNSACLYCAVPPHGDTHGFTPLDEVRAHIRAGVGAGCDRAIFVGGEPTIYPHLDDALAALRDEGLEGRHVLMTNGLRLADEGFVTHLRREGIATVHLSIDTVDEAIYDRLSRAPGTFARQVAALDRVLREPGLRLYVYAAVTRLNEANVVDLVRHVARRAQAARREPPPILLAFMKPIGDAKVHADILHLAPRERASIARRAVACAREVGVPIGIRNLQACLAPELVPLLVDHYLDDHSVDLATRARVPFAHNTEHIRKLASCAGCAHATICPGVYRDDEREDGFAPIAEADALILPRG